MSDFAAIEKTIESLEKYKEEIRIAQEMLKGELENDPLYVEASEKAKETATTKKRIKEEILNAGPNAKIVEDIKYNTEEISTLKEVLSAQLVDFYSKSGTDQIADRKFVVSAKLLPKNAKGDKRNFKGQFSEE